MQFLFTTPTTRSTIDDGKTITGMKILQTVINPDTLVATTLVQAIEDSGRAASFIPSTSRSLERRR